MGKTASIAGWMVFIAAILGAIFRKGPDGPITASMKASGAYQPAMTILAILIGQCVLLLIREVRKAVKAARTLEELRKKRMQ